MGTEINTYKALLSLALFQGEKHLTDHLDFFYALILVDINSL